LPILHPYSLIAGADFGGLPVLPSFLPSKMPKGAGAENRSGGFYAVVLVGSDWSCRYRPCLVANSSKEIAPDFSTKNQLSG